MRQFNRQGLAEPVTYDYVFHPVVAGGRLYFGSSTEEAVTCLDAATGQTRWMFHTEGAVRFAPVVDGPRLIVASDDGCVYALDAATGALRWKQPVAARSGYCTANGRPASAWPVRGGLSVVAGRVYCAAGIFPEQEVNLAALDSETGAVQWRREVPYALSGEMLVDGDILWAATHRTSPAQFKFADGTPLVPDPPVLLSRGAGQMWKIDGLPAWGPDEGGIIYIRMAATDETSSKKRFAGSKETPTVLGQLSTLDGWAAVASPRHFFLLQDDRVLALNTEAFRAAVADRLAAIRSGKERSAIVPAYSKLMGSLADEDEALRNRLEKAAMWARDLPLAETYRAAIVAGDYLVLGGKNKVTVLDVAKGTPAWSVAVEGLARGLAAAGEALYVSTDTGRFYCFRAASSPLVQHQPAVIAPWPADRAREDFAARLVETVARRKGVCVVLGGGDGQLAGQLARQSEFFVIVFEPDAAKAALQRQKLTQAGLYGRRVVVRHESGRSLSSYPAGFANLVVADGPVAYDPRAIERLVQPYGGVTMLAGILTRRGPLPGAGQWPDANGNPANTMNSGETRVPADGSALRLQWFGAPYAADIVDRHAVPMPPLFHSGILVQPGRNGLVTALDAYNGTLLWNVQIPLTRRILASHNASPMAFAEDGRFLFAVSGSECLVLDAVTGRQTADFDAASAGCDWGYVGSVGHLLLGSSQDREANEVASGESKQRQVNAGQSWSLSSVSVSRDLFADDYRQARRPWAYRGGRILNPSITIADGRVFFAESRNRVAEADKTGLIKMGDWLASDAGGGPAMVALDLATGKELWRRPITRDINAPHHWLMYLSSARGLLLATRGLFKQEGDAVRRGYDFEALDAATGKTVWARWVPSRQTGTAFGLGYGKNSLSARPVIVGDRFFIRSNFASDANAVIMELNLLTGEPTSDLLPSGIHHAGCSVPIGSASALYFRDWLHASFDIATRKRYGLTGVTRPSCWPSTLPVGGLVLAPEGSAGCSCGLSYQMSFALAPQTEGETNTAEPKQARRMDLK